MTKSIVVIRAAQYLKLREAVRKFESNPITANKHAMFDLVGGDKHQKLAVSSSAG